MPSHASLRAQRTFRGQLHLRADHTSVLRGSKTLKVRPPFVVVSVSRRTAANSQRRFVCSLLRDLSLLLLLGQQRIERVGGLATQRRDMGAAAYQLQLEGQTTLTRCSHRKMQTADWLLRKHDPCGPVVLSRCRPRTCPCTEGTVCPSGNRGKCNSRSACREAQAWPLW